MISRGIAPDGTNMMRATGFVGALLLAAVACTGCAAGTPVSAATPSPAPSTAPSASGTEKNDPTESSEVAGDCLIGDWFVAEDQLQGFYDVAGSSSGAQFDVVGGTGLSFTDAGYTYTPDFTLNLTVAGQTAEGTLTGSISGNYSSDGEVVTTSNDASNIAMTVRIGGTEVDAGEQFNAFLGLSPINAAPYECQNGAPTIMFGAGDNPRVPVVLTPAP